MNPCKRKCHDCGNVAMHEDRITPWVLCKKCGSQDTRLVKEPTCKPDLPVATTASEKTCPACESAWNAIEQRCTKCGCAVCYHPHRAGATSIAGVIAARPSPSCRPTIQEPTQRHPVHLPQWTDSTRKLFSEFRKNPSKWTCIYIRWSIL